MNCPIHLRRLCLAAALFCIATLCAAVPALAQQLPVPMRAVEQPSAAVIDTPVAQPVSLSVLVQPGEPGFVPLTGQQRSRLYFAGVLASPETYEGVAGMAGLDMFMNEPEGWRQGPSGFCKRFGSELVWKVTAEGVRQSGDAAVGLDPRYYSSRSRNPLRRFGHAITMSFFAYDSQGHLRPDIPRAAGDYGASMLQTAGYPPSYSPWVQGVKSGHISMGFDVARNVVREFTPELKRLFGRH